MAGDIIATIRDKSISFGVALKHLEVVGGDYKVERESAARNFVAITTMTEGLSNKNQSRN